jgi:hypothetical protein
MILLAMLFTYGLTDYQGYLQDATETLKGCHYLKTAYPAEHKRLDVVRPEIVLLDVQGPELAFVHGEVIFLSPKIWKDIGERRVDYKRLFAHELLHVINLPRHKHYDTKEDYLANDPIEFVISACFIEGE